MYYILIAVALLLLSCNNIPSTPVTDQAFIDSFIIAKKADSATQRVIKDALFDTVGVSTAPVKVLSAKLIGREYSNYKDIRLTWKNTGTKEIAAIRFMWYGLNAFSEPADMGGHIQPGFGGGLADRSLGVGKSDAGTWEIMSKDGRKVVMAWPYEIAFEDGTKWKSGK